MDALKSYKAYSVFVFIIIVGILLRTICFINNPYNIIGDECHTIVASVLPVKELFFNYMQGANMLPLYKVLMRIIYDIFGFNWVLFRLPSYIAGVLSIFLFYRIIQKVFKNKFVIITALTLFSFNYSLIWYSVKIKPYEIEVFIALLALYTVLSINDNYKETKYGYYIPIKNLLLMTFTSVLFIFTSIPSIVIVEMYWFLLIFQDLILKNFKNAKNLLFCQLIIIGAFTFEFFTLIIKIQSDLDLKGQWTCSEFYFKPDSIDALNSLLYFCFFKQCMFDSEITDKLPLFFIILVLICFISGIYFLVKNSINSLKNNFNYESFSNLYIVLPVLTFILLSFLNIFPFTNRVILFLVPHIIIIVLYTFNQNKTEFKYYLNGFLIIFLLFYICCISSKEYLLPDILFNNSISNANKNIIRLIENVKSNDEIILSSEKLCVYCVDNSDIYTFEEFNPLLDIDEENKEFFFNKVRKKINYKFDENIFKGKNKIYYIESQDPFSVEQDEKLLDIINKHGFNEVYRKNENIFLPYVVFEK